MTRVPDLGPYFDRLMRAIPVNEELLEMATRVAVKSVNGDRVAPFRASAWRSGVGDFSATGDSPVEAIERLIGSFGRSA